MTNHTHPDLWETLVLLTGGDISLSEAHDTILAMINQGEDIGIPNNFKNSNMDDGRFYAPIDLTLDKFKRLSEKEFHAEYPLFDNPKYITK